MKRLLLGAVLVPAFFVPSKQAAAECMYDTDLKLMTCTGEENTLKCVQKGERNIVTGFKWDQSDENTGDDNTVSSQKKKKKKKKTPKKPKDEKPVLLCKDLTSIVVLDPGLLTIAGGPFNPSRLSILAAYSDDSEEGLEVDASNFRGKGIDFEGGPSDDVFTAGGGTYTLNGNEGDDVLIGGDGKDVIDGGDGDDYIDGGKGKNTLTGGTGDDTFVERDGDTITDFKDGTDPDDEEEDSLVPPDDSSDDEED